MRQSYLNDLAGNTLMTMCESPAMHRRILFCRTLFLCELPAVCRFDFKVWLHLGFGESLKTIGIQRSRSVFFVKLISKGDLRQVAWSEIFGYLSPNAILARRDIVATPSASAPTLRAASRSIDAGEKKVSTGGPKLRLGDLPGSQT